MKRNRIVVCCCIAIIVLGVVGFRQYNQSRDKESLVVATVDGHEISYEEYMHQLNGNRAIVHSYFYHTYSIGEGDDFWHTTYGNERPLDVIKKKTLDQLVEIKAIQIEAYKQGILDDTHYSAFKEDLVNENKRRRECIKENIVIYGPAQYDERDYYSYLHRNRVTMLKEILQESYFTWDEEALEAYYHKRKEEDYRKVGALKLESLHVQWVSNEDKEKAHTLAGEIEKALLSGASFQAMKEEYNPVDGVSIAVHQHDYNPYNTRYDNAAAYEYIQLALAMEEGDYSQIIEEKDGYAIIRLQHREEDSYHPYSAVTEHVLKGYIDWKFQDYMDAKVSQATVSIDEKAYDAIDVQ